MGIRTKRNARVRDGVRVRRVRSRMAVTSLSLVLGVGGLGSAAPAGAQPVDNPCDLAIGLLCQFLPIAPQLDHDIDLTVEQVPALPPADVPPVPAPVCHASACN